MRKINFRGICIAEGAFKGMFVYGDLLQRQGKTYISPHANAVRVDGHIGNLIIMHEIDPETVGQFTGLLDRNGREIHEGDVVRFLDAYVYGENGDWDDCECIGQIKWDDVLAQFYVTNRESMGNDVFWEQVNEAEVIGNIYENPELLES